MELILMRHAKTPTTEECGVHKDGDRFLLETGKEQAKRAGKALAKMDLVPGRILASPLLRAQQTAERALKGLDKDLKLETLSELAAGNSTEDLLEALKAYSGESTLMLVGHQPDLGSLASVLLFGADSGAIALKPGGMMLLELDSLSPGSGASLRWLLVPSQIESIG